MAYCRFSSDNWNCDVYAYPDCDGGYVTHVAVSRLESAPPPVPLYSEVSPEIWRKYHDLNTDFVQACPRVTIGLPCDGRTFRDDTLEDLLDRLTSLRKWGYRIPDNVFNLIREEIADEKKEQK